MKRIGIYKFIATPLYGAFKVIAQHGESFYSKLFLSLSFICIANLINVNEINYTSIMTDEASSGTKGTKILRLLFA